MKIQKIELTDFGKILAINEKQTQTNNSLTGYFLHSESIEFINHLDVIKGAIGLTFGIEYFLNGEDDQECQDAHFISRILHPIITNPSTNISISETVERKYNYLNQINFDYFVFEFDWEVMPGKWTFQIIEEESVILEKSFIIT